MSKQSLINVPAVTCLRQLADRLECGELTLKYYHTEQGLVDIRTACDGWRTAMPDGNFSLTLEVVGKTEVSS